MFVSLVKGIVLTVTLLIWTVLGFIIYLPMLFRLTAYFSGMILVASFQKVDLTLAQKRLEYGVRFYPNGFAMILKAFKKIEEDNDNLDGPPVNFVKFLDRIWLDLVWGLIFWGSILLIFFPTLLSAIKSITFLIGWWVAIVIGILFIIIILLSFFQKNPEN